MGKRWWVWFLLRASQAEELKAMKFRTVDSIAGASDAAIAKLGMMAGMAPHAFRTKAQGFLAAAQNSTMAEQREAELKAAQDREAAMQAEMASLKAQVEHLTEIATAPEPAPRKRLGWPKGKKRKPQLEATP